MFEYDNCSSGMLNRLRSAISKIPSPKTRFEPSIQPANEDDETALAAAPKKKQKSKSKDAVIDNTSATSSSATDASTATSDGATTDSDTVGIDLEALKAKAVLDEAAKIDLRARFMLVRSGILGAVHKIRPQQSSLRDWCEGQRAFVVCPISSPPYIQKVLKVVAKTVKDAQKPESRGIKPKQPVLNLLVGLADGERVMPAKEVQAMVKLPELDTLRAQVVGMLEGQGRTLVGVLGQAGGGGLVRTLQGLEQGMKENQGGAASAEA